MAPFPMEDGAMRRNSLGPIDYFLFFSSASRSANGW